MIKRILIILAIMFKLLPGQQKSDAIYAQVGEEDPSYYMCLPGEWEDDPGFDWNAIWELVDQVNEQNQQENQDWINEMNEWVQEQFDESTEIWDEFYNEYQDGGDYQDWLDYLDYINNLLNNPSSSTTCPTDITFSEDLVNDKYGYDFVTNLVANGPIWKSVEQAHSSTVNIAITPAGDYASVGFKVVIPANLTITPTFAPSAAFSMTFNGPASANKLATQVQGNCAGVNGTTINKIDVVTYTKATKTVLVTVINSLGDGGTYLGYASTDVTQSVIEDYLNTVIYNQGVVHWNVSHSIAPLIVPFDLDKDSKFNDNATNTPTTEMQYIIDHCMQTGYDVNLFLVDNFLTTNGTGVSPTGGSWSFVDAKKSLNPKNTIAHELGHSGYGFIHADYVNDVDNIMYDTYGPDRDRMRKPQWDTMHP